jgi:hypothetical protein
MALAIVIVSAAITLGAQAASSASMQHPPAAPPLTFGIYPGGAAGTVGPAGRLVPEEPAKRLLALKQLHVPGRPFVLHLYASYAGRNSMAPADQVGEGVARYTSAGFQVELVLTYRPVRGAPAENARGFAHFARSAMETFGANPRFAFLQVANEVNVGGAPDAADGARPGAQDALIQGVIAASAAARKQGLGHVGVGFNWAYSTGPHESAFWHRLGRAGGSTFRRSVDWVGLDLYPRTWGPKVGGGLAAATRKTTLAALRALRSRFMPMAGLSASLPLHISENGFPTGPGRTEAMQVTAMQAAVSTVNANRATYRVTDYRWFDLRDADSSSGSFESRYGLMRDDYTPKAGFGAYRKLIATLAPAA